MFEEKINEITLENNGQDNAENSGDVTLEKNKELPRSFTQNEVDEIVKTRLARALKNMPSKDELLEFENLKKLNEENEAVIEKLKTESEFNVQRLLTYERKEVIGKKGIEDKFKDYVMFEAAKNVNDETDFETAVDILLNENEWLLKQKSFKTGLSQGTNNGGISGLEESFYRRNPKLR